MPCYEVNRISVKIEAADRQLLEAAIKSLGFPYVRDLNDFAVAGISITGSRAWLESPKYQDKLNAIKRAYSKQVVAKKMAQKKWVGTWRKTTTKEPEIELTKY